MSAPQEVQDRPEEQRKRFAICSENLVGRLVRHNFDLGVFRVVEDNMGMRVKVEAIPSSDEKFRDFARCAVTSYSVDSLRPA